MGICHGCVLCVCMRAPIIGRICAVDSLIVRRREVKRGPEGPLSAEDRYTLWTLMM